MCYASCLTSIAFCFISSVFIHAITSPNTRYSSTLRPASCWLNPMGGAMWGEVLPIGILVAATIFLLANTFFTQQMPPVLVEEGHRGRQRYESPASHSLTCTLNDLFTCTYLITCMRDQYHHSVELLYHCPLDGHSISSFLHPSAVTARSFAGWCSPCVSSCWWPGAPGWPATSQGTRAPTCSSAS